MTPQTTPLYLIIYFDDDTNGKYPIVGWVPSNAGPEAWAPVVVIWENRVALTIYSDTRSVVSGDRVRGIKEAYLGGSK